MALLDAFNLKNLVSAPSYLQGIASPEQIKSAENQAIFQGLLGAGLGYLAQPKNQGYGSAVPYLAKAGLQGLQSAQQPFQQLEKDVLMKERFDEMARKKAEKERLQRAIEGFKARPETTDIQRMGLDIAPEATIKELVRPEKGETSPSTDIQLLNRYEYVSKQLEVNPNDPYLSKEKRAIELKLGLVQQPKDIPTEAEQLKKDLTPAQTEFDKKAVPDLIDFQIKGGFSDIQKQVKQLDDTIELLKTSPEGDITGKKVGVAEQAGMLDYYNPTAKAAQERVQEVVQRNLRLILGAAFTAKEGENLISRAYNPKLSQAENVKRIEALKKQMIDAAKSKQEALNYYTEKGTLQGFEGETYKKSLQEASQPTIQTTTAPTQSGFKEGAKTKSKSGKAMIFTNGQWEYE